MSSAEALLAVGQNVKPTANHNVIAVSFNLFIFNLIKKLNYNCNVIKKNFKVKSGLK
jgi:hypothetical protein